MDMGSGKIPLDMKLIQWIDPKKVPQPDPAPHTSDERRMGDDVEIQEGEETSEGV